MLCFRNDFHGLWRRYPIKTVLDTIHFDPEEVQFHPQIYEGGRYVPPVFKHGWNMNELIREEDEDGVWNDLDNIDVDGFEDDLKHHKLIEETPTSVRTSVCDKCLVLILVCMYTFLVRYSCHVPVAVTNQHNSDELFSQRYGDSSGRGNLRLFEERHKPRQTNFLSNHMYGGQRPEEGRGQGECN